MEETVKLEYNTEREKLQMPEYGRNVLNMSEQLRNIPDREKRSQQARAVVKVMELLNPQVRSEENWERKLWDQLYIMAGLDLDIDSPYPVPTEEQINLKPQPIPLQDNPVKARHYGRNIESIIDLIAGLEEWPMKSEMIRSLACYMRQQYLIWNKDSVADGTIFADIEELSDGRITIPEGLSLPKISNDASFQRPNMNAGSRNGRGGRNKHRNKK